MTASSDFPRSYPAQAYSAGGTASIALPAVPGIAHVIESFFAKVQVGVAGAGAFSPIVSVTAASLGTVTIGTVGVNLATLEAVDTDSNDSMDLAAALGEAVTIAFSAGNADVVELLRIKAHDI